MVGSSDVSVLQSVLVPWFVTLQCKFERDNYSVIQFSFVLHYVCIIW